MLRASLKTMQLEVILLLCVAGTFAPGRCGTKAEQQQQQQQQQERARLPEFLSELDLASLEASEEDVEALKKVVKRLAPEKNVFFGNEDLLNEWLKGAGVTGQPGVDFPALTTIPVTSFSCRGLKGGYYADLETNCQVFHICDNGRKISFLCPNGTIFQQSQLICDWWFKVDCSKSAELYEQSAEQLAEEERKRAEAKRMNSEFHRASEDDKTQSYDQTQNGDYDGRQNGRMNPYGQSPKQNQIADNQQTVKSNEQFNQAFNQPPRGQYQQNTDYHQERKGKSNEEHYQQQELNYHSANRQQNQLVSEQSGKADQYQYNQRGSNKYQKDYQDNSQRNQDYYGSAANQNTARTERPKNLKSRPSSRVSVNTVGVGDQKVTPTYTETTTFRTTTSSPIKEYQQLAESAAFVSNRGNHYNSKAYNQQQYNYQSYTNRVSNTESVDRQSTTSVPGKNKSEPATSRTRFSIPPFPGPTFAPIYKPRTTSSTTPATYETTLQAVTTETPTYSTDYYNRQSYQAGTSYSPYSGNQEYQTTTQSYYSEQNRNHYTTYNYDSQKDQTTVRYDQNYYRNSESTQNYNENSGNVEQTTQSYEQSYYGNTDSYRSNGVTNRDVSQDTAVFPTTRTYTENRQDAATSQTVTEPSDQNYYGRSTTVATTNYYNNANSWDRQVENVSRFTTRGPQRSSQINRQNSISVSTEKPARSTQSYQANNYQNSGATGKTLSPYDTSFTYKQGKVMSTLGPYVPFTKNYVYPITSTTTSKPPVYTATVPTYSSTIANYRATAKNLLPKIKSPTASPGKSKTAATYLPESSTKKLGALENRPETEREHALSMLESLSQLENNMQGLSNRSSGVSSSSGPSTLHSLALYFATANDSFDSKEATDSAVSIQYQPVTQDSSTPKPENSTVELPTSILTQHTINSYAELFNLNNALEGNATTAEGFDGDLEEPDDSSDLDLDQSEGPVNGAKKSNGTKLRELAQVFTHALSAYLQDPDTFKKVLTEIRPTEPPSTSLDDQNEVTTQYPTTIDEYPSVTKEKDEVLDFSDDTNGVLRRKPTTYSTTTQASTGNTYQTFYPSANEYYTTPFSPVQDNRYESTTLTYNELKSGEQNNYYTTTTQPSSNNYAFAVNNVFGQGNQNDVSSYNPSGPDDSSQSYENYFPSGSAETRVGGFQNNSAKTYAAYGKYVRPSDATPISDNYVASSTPPSYTETQETVAYGENNYSGNKQPDLELAPPFFESYAGGNASPAGFTAAEKVTGLPERTEAPAVTPIPIEIIGVSSTSQPFRIRYFDAGNTEAPDKKSSEESLVTARSAYNSYRTEYEDNQETTTTASPLSRTLDPVTTVVSNVEDNSRQQNTVAREVLEEKSPEDTTGAQSTGSARNDHWTTSPVVTQFWDSTVYIDPQNINQGLEQAVTQAPVTDFPFTERLVRSTTPSLGLESFTDASNEVTHGQNELSTPWQWSPNNNDSPTAFTLLPTAFNRENTATPTPIYTTSSSITTTITSSVTSTNTVPQDTLIPSLLPFTAGAGTFNATENEIIKANEMFGKLNASSTNTLMKVMRQADNNATVRQLVLLLINHCNGPMNKTMEEEKEHLLDALLRMPVNEFTSEESREIVAGITKLNLPIGRSRFISIPNPQTRSPVTTSTTTTTTTTAKPSVTTFRSRKGRKFRTSTPANISRRSDESKAEEPKNSLDDTTASDNRALELLRSLYTIAAKWG